MIAIEQESERLARLERARFKASLVTQLLSGQLAANTFDWNDYDRDIRHTIELADDILERVGLPE